MGNSTTTNPGILGLFGFAMTTFLLLLINAGIEPVSNIKVVFGMSIVFRGYSTSNRGIFEYGKSNTLGFSAFN